MFKEKPQRISHETASQKEPDLVEWNEERTIRLKKSGPILLLRRKDGRLEPGWFINTTKHTGFTPAFRVEVKSGRLIGRSFPFIFKFFYGKGDEEVYEVPVNHVFKKGLNIVFPSIEIPTERITHGRYRFQVLIPADIVLDRMEYSVIKTREERAKVGKDGVFEFDEIDPRDVGVQDLIDMLDQE